MTKHLSSFIVLARQINLFEIERKSNHFRTCFVCRICIHQHTFIAQFLCMIVSKQLDKPYINFNSGRNLKKGR